LSNLTLDEFTRACEKLAADGPALVGAVTDLAAWGELRNALVGRSSGRLTDIMGTLGSLPKDDRRAAGQLANATKLAIEGLLETRRAELAGAAKAVAVADPTMPGRQSWRGSVHPVSLVIDEISEIFRELGFSIALGPEVVRVGALAPLLGED